MRSGIAAGLMGIGGILVAFGAVVVALSLFARQGGDTRLQLPAMAMLATGSLAIGAVMFAAGFLLGRFRRNSADYTSRRP
ncbi:MAG TPA: hypothetical protein VK494_09255 [Gemmatimonadaceae bacterium]|nr:hypothetical protein [Gemmatimonadaceae bacterium]